MLKIGMTIKLSAIKQLEMTSIIKQLSQITINRIAAGEVVERPASAVKELVENSIDAGASEIVIRIEAGGRNLISIIDNGTGMSKDDLALSFQSHTTSKLDEEDISNINFFGFRGEALASISSVSRMSIKSKAKGLDEEHGWEADIIAGELKTMTPCSISQGTKIDVRDLFFATPARLKFLRSEKSETQAIIDTIKKIAVAMPQIGFKLYNNEKLILDLLPETSLNNDLYLTRISHIIGDDFENNAARINNFQDSMSLAGYCSVPTYNKSSANDLYLYVNYRPVKDKIILASVRAAYQDYLAPNRYPVVILFLNIPNNDIDVNVHPSKIEVRFKDPSQIRGFIISSLRQALLSKAQHTSTLIASDFITRAKISPDIQFMQNIEAQTQNNYPNISRSTNSFEPSRPSNSYKQKIEENYISLLTEIEPSFKSSISTESSHAEANNSFRLGAARCQLHNTYIVSQTSDSIIIVDQHAAHERLVYEKLKKQISEQGISTQKLLSPIKVELNHEQIECFIQRELNLNKLGLVYKIEDASLIVTDIPAILAQTDVNKLVHDIAHDFESLGEELHLSETLCEILATFACHHSVRAGRMLSVSEMNSLLREMESTLFSGQCNHGRPTYIELRLKDIENLFGRT